MLSIVLPLIGIPIIIVGFILRLNTLLVVVVAGIVTALAVGMDVLSMLEIFGEKFMTSRQLATFALILPVIGLLEKFGLREHARNWISKVRGATVSRILIFYFSFREITAMLGLVNLGGHAQIVRPILAPMAEGVAQAKYGKELPVHVRDLIRAHCAACDNVAVFFGEDIFIAFGAVLLIDSFLKDNGILNIEPLHIGLWAIPTAICAFIVHCTRIAFLDRKIAKELAKYKELDNG